MAAESNVSRQLRTELGRASKMHGHYVGTLERDLQRYNEYEERRSDLRFTAEDAHLAQVYAALAVLCAGSLRVKADTSRVVERAIKEVADEERRLYGPEAFPYLDEAFPNRQFLLKFPRDWEQAASSDGLKKLHVDEIRHEWTIKPGKRLFLRLAKSVRATPGVNDLLCGTGGLHERLVTQESGEAELLRLVAGALLTTLGVGVLGASVTAPVSVIIVRRGLRAFCLATF